MLPKEHQENSGGWKSMEKAVLRSGLWHMQSVLHGVMEEEDVRALYLWLERLARNPHTEDEARSIVAGVYTPCRPLTCTT